ncbi:NAD-glutamate dehydrogenase [Variovorax sp. J22R133]|uniref:NAD-glutamate dehydrogenase n=1 Tax=Variovorax brevis TaxID=3053503 RepID=UPI002575B1DD|nr:NAD-glutamate dehydrogenase [Variovorax sp. J22R133]MDM0110583.1 NAD-glutamate dehydrogenase [Variovorax sp. J22R133]
MSSKAVLELLKAANWLGIDSELAKLIDRGIRLMPEDKATTILSRLERDVSLFDEILAARHDAFHQIKIAEGRSVATVAGDLSSFTADARYSLDEARWGDLRRAYSASLAVGNEGRRESSIALGDGVVGGEDAMARGLDVFGPQYLGQITSEDLAERQPADVYGAALSHWNFARKRERGQITVRVFNPSIAEHGWQSTHSIIEIVNDDMPFLVDTVTMEVNRHGLRLHLIIHPLIHVRRDAQGHLQDVGAEDAPRESFIHVEVDRVANTAQLEALASDVKRVLGDVRLAVTDWQKMRQRALDIVAQLEKQTLPIPTEEKLEEQAFLRWLADGHFTFLGHRSNDLVNQGGEDTLKAVPGSGLGILRESGMDLATRFAALPPQVRANARLSELLIITKSTSRSTVHRQGYLDYIGIKRLDAQGQVVGEDCFLGLFTHTAYNARPADIPLLRRKVADVLARAGLPAGSHSEQALVNILEGYPRDELFQTAGDELLEIAMDVMHLEERQRFRLFVRREPYERFVVCMIYAPRESYATDVRQRWQAILEQAFNGRGSEFNVHLSESMLARIQITVRTKPGEIPPYDVRELEQRLAASARRWEDDLKFALIESAGEAHGNALLRQYDSAFPAGYRDEFAARVAVHDIALIEKLGDTLSLGMNLYRPLEASPGMLRFKLVVRGTPLVLSTSLPMMEHLGMRVLDEQLHRIAKRDGSMVWVHDFGLASANGETELDVDALRPMFEEAFGAVYTGAVENDDFNRLVLAARLPAHDIVLLRAYAKYMKQIGFSLSQAFVESTLVANAAIARNLVELFRLRFDPAAAVASGDTVQTKTAEIELALEQVTNLSEDRVLRNLLSLMMATTRTNFWRRDAKGARRGFVSFKFDSRKVPDLPAPKPMFEIFVYSTRFEGVHLRGGRVARGGLRWSDRPEDFRTEVLGLVKAEMVKNTVIVPVGSTGGFVLKRAPPPADRDAYMKEGVACYQDYLRGLLDITDNLAGVAVVPPPDVRRLDEDDPYLVVAADKGTANFSDYANGVSVEYGFWLGDAFASGGSVGYDQKAMGITARGAWESVKRHFREMGIDTQCQDFTVAGIGDMSGDVFGNGMLLSRHICLVAAFDHRHIFLDPKPEPEKTFVERDRMFKLPRSSWGDYDTSLISKGGGIHSRSAESIALTPEVKVSLGIDAMAEHMTPTELINAILKSPVQLIYNGGTGTYVKASYETHTQVGDRANDVLRVDGKELRCKVFAEGGNLGCTQLGRIEFARAGGRINTDAIDNSAGVDTSDHEVNIKILLGLPQAEGELTEKQRHAILADTTDEVAQLVLRDNVLQTQILSITNRVAPQMLDAQTRFMQFLEKAARLNRVVEFLPADEEIAERRAAGQGLATPEAASLLAHSKMWLYDELLASRLPDDPWVASALERYFPTLLRRRFADWIPKHPLKREIIATYVTNSTINRVGSTFVHRLLEITGAHAFEVVRAYLMSREIFGMVPLWTAVEALGNKVDDALQSRLLIDISQQLERATKWFLRSRRLAEDMQSVIDHFKPNVDALSARLPQLLGVDKRGRDDAAVLQYLQGGVPRELAERVVTFDSLNATLDIAELAGSAGWPVELVAAVYFDLANRLGMLWLRDRIAALPGDAHWQMLAKGTMLDDLSGLERSIAATVLAGGRDEETESPDTLVYAWQVSNGRTLEGASRLMAELRTVSAPDAAMLSAVLQELRALT